MHTPAIQATNTQKFARGANFFQSAHNLHAQAERESAFWTKAPFPRRLAASSERARAQGRWVSIGGGQLGVAAAYKARSTATYAPQVFADLAREHRRGTCTLLGVSRLCTLPIARPALSLSHQCCNLHFEADLLNRVNFPCVVRSLSSTTTKRASGNTLLLLEFWMQSNWHTRKRGSYINSRAQWKTDMSSIKLCFFSSLVKEENRNILRKLNCNCYPLLLKLSNLKFKGSRMLFHRWKAIFITFRSDRRTKKHWQV